MDEVQAACHTSGMKTFMAIALAFSLSAQSKEIIGKATTLCPQNLEEVTCLMLACNQAQMNAKDEAKKICGGIAPKVDIFKSAITGVPMVFKMAGQARCSYKLHYSCP